MRASYRLDEGDPRTSLQTLTEMARQYPGHVSLVYDAHGWVTSVHLIDLPAPVRVAYRPLHADGFREVHADRPGDTVSISYQLHHIPAGGQVMTAAELLRLGRALAEACTS